LSKCAVKMLHLVWAVPVALAFGAWMFLVAVYGWASAVENDSAILLTGAVSIAALLLAGGWTAGVLLVAPWSADWKLKELWAVRAGSMVSAVGLSFVLLNWAVSGG